MIKQNKIIIVFIIFIISLCGCKLNRDKKVLKINLETEKRIKLSENKRPIGIITDLRISGDSIIYVLDISSADVKKYNLEGEFIGTIGRRSNDPKGLRTPRSLEVNASNVVISDVGFYAIKCFKLNGEIERIIFIEGFRPVFGNTKVIGHKILCTSLWDDERNFDKKPCLIIVDTTGKILQKVGEFPSEYKEVDNIDATRWLDINSKGDYVISFIKSPALYMGNIYDGKGELIEMSSRTTRYISSIRKNGQIMEDQWKILRQQEEYNGVVRFLNDSVLVRSVSSATRESIQSSSQILEKHRIELINLKGSIIAETNIKGVLREVFNGMLIIEEDDNPENRIISFNKINWRYVNEE